MVTLKHIRLYERVYSPSHFVGLLGFVIRSLNVLRYYVELLVQRLVLKYEVAKQVQPALRAQRESGLVKRFWLDDQKERLSLREEQVAEVQPLVETSLETGKAVPTRAVTAEFMIARYSPGGRSKRYAHLATPLVSEDFEAVSKEGT